MQIHKVYRFFFRRFRPARIKRLYDAMGITAESSVIDIGGRPEFWRMVLDQGLPVPKLTIVNIERRPEHLPAGIDWHRADARSLPFADRSFDIAVSNSVIEHVGDYESQRRFAAEARRVARKYFIQTPNLAFPIEPHYMAPFVHWLPRAVRPHLLRFSPWGLIAKPSLEERRAIVDEIRLLGHAEMRSLFPEAQIISERCLGLAKSLIAQQTA